MHVDVQNVSVCAYASDALSAVTRLIPFCPAWPPCHPRQVRPVRTRHTRQRTCPFVDRQLGPSPNTACPATPARLSAGRLHTRGRANVPAQPWRRRTVCPGRGSCPIAREAGPGGTHVATARQSCYRLPRFSQERPVIWEVDVLKWVMLHVHHNGASRSSACLSYASKYTASACSTSAESFLRSFAFVCSAMFGPWRMRSNAY